MRLLRSDSVLVVIDVQQKLMPVIEGQEELARNVERLVRGCHLLGVPIVVTEQYVRGLGATIEPLRRALEETAGYAPIEKACFSAHGCADFAARLAALGRRQVLVCGIETHVCVHQTVGDLTEAGYGVTVIADAVSSRAARNREIAFRRFESDGVKLSSTEMVLFELLGVSGTDEFRAISRLIR
ncbi:MAG TPA: isochorismatase family protein [Thermoanaerobaculia bacterium]|jgi:nicotinamidase-related amidase